MKSLLNVILALVTVGALAWGALTTQKLFQLQKDKTVQEAEHALQTSRLEHLDHTLAELAETKRLLEAAQSQTQTPTPPDNDAQAVAPAAEAEAVTPVDENTGTGQEPSQDEIEQKARQERIIKTQMAIVVDMGYSELFNVLKLSPEAQPKMRDLLVDYAYAEREATLEAMRSGDVPAKEVLKEKEKAMADLRSTLSDVLSTEEMATWEEYEKYKDQNLYESLLEGQLAMLAPNLTETNRKVAKQVIAEELNKSIQQFEASDETYTMDHFNEAQSRALHQGLDRLVETLPENEFLELEKFTKVAEDMFKATAQNQN